MRLCKAHRCKLNQIKVVQSLQLTQVVRADLSVGEILKGDANVIDEPDGRIVYKDDYVG